ncbi:EamA domain-containing protein [Rhodovastum atsumiense]|uniref:DMT family transporter n=1 Tax=Rhodovastum atsumiense TaxID=504468 RepID=UPI00193B171A|nr:DMT family transporter [Rhodovastum atsumiense]CAH2599400.1 EamA domain-containing protein [Rhodovastum atsumiense]
MAPPPRHTLHDTGTDTVRGILLACICYMLLTVGDAAVKWALPVVGLAGAMFGRAAFGLPTVALLARAQETSMAATWARLRPVRKGMVALRSLVHAFVSFAWYVAWQQGMTLADSYALGYVVPLLMTLLAIPMLGERIHWRRATSTLIGFAGVMVMLRPGGIAWTPVLLLFIAGLVALAVSRIMNRMLATTETPECLSFWLLAAHVPAGVLLAAMYAMPALTPAATAALLLIGVSNGVAHWLQSRAFALAPVSALAPYEYTTLLWGGALGWLVFAELPSRDALVGAAIVAAAGLYNLHREQVRRRQEEKAAAAASGGAVAGAAAMVHRRPD